MQSVDTAEWGRGGRERDEQGGGQLDLTFMY